MKAVKFLTCCILAAFIIFMPAGTRTARAAAPRYARADARDVYFCERKDLNYALFTIPYTYCVEILSTEGEWYYVKYAEDNDKYRALYGYCLSEKLTPLETPPENIYLNRPVTVTFKADPPVGSLPVLDALNVTAAFYGTYYSGATAYSYVYYNGAFGYVYGANDDYPLNEIPTDETEQPPAENKGKTNTTVIIALALSALAAAALFILYLTGRKSKYFRPYK